MTIRRCNLRYLELAMVNSGIEIGKCANECSVVTHPPTQMYMTIFNEFTSVIWPYKIIVTGKAFAQSIPEQIHIDRSIILNISINYPYPQYVDHIHFSISIYLLLYSSTQANKVPYCIVC